MGITLNIEIWFDKNPWLMIRNRLTCNHKDTSNIEHMNAHQHTHRVVYQDCCRFGLSIKPNTKVDARTNLNFKTGSLIKSAANRVSFSEKTAVP